MNFGFSMGVKLSLGDFENSGNTSSVPLGSANFVLLGVNMGDPTFEKSLSNFLFDIGETTLYLPKMEIFKQ